MKYQCLNPDCKKSFIKTAKKSSITVTVLFKDDKPESETSNDNSISTKTATEGFEKRVCPYCESVDIDDLVEVQTEISSVKSVPLAEVDDLLKEGYVVESLYAKTATLVKREIK